MENYPNISVVVLLVVFISLAILYSHNTAKERRKFQCGVTAALSLVGTLIPLSLSMNRGIIFSLTSVAYVYFLLLVALSLFVLSFLGNMESSASA